MLGITFHNPATISVFLDRMRFRDCFISNDELRKGEWERKLKAFVDLPSDGRDRVLFVESFATLQGLVQHGAALESVKVAVYDDCNVLSKVPGANIVDAHINGSSADTWQLYTVSFAEFNDALAQQPTGVPALIRDHDVKQDDDIPEPPRASKQTTETADDADDEEETKPKPTSMLVMEQILDDIERDDDDDDDDEDEPKPYQPERLPDEALVALPEPDRGRVVLRKRQPGEVQTQAPPELDAPPTGPMEVEPATAEQIVEAVGATEEEKELARDVLETVSKRSPERKPEPKATPEPEPEEPKTKKRRKRSKKPDAPQSYKLF